MTQTASRCSTMFAPRVAAALTYSVPSACWLGLCSPLGKGQYLCVRNVWTRKTDLGCRGTCARADKGPSPRPHPQGRRAGQGKNAKGLTVTLTRSMRACTRFKRVDGAVGDRRRRFFFRKWLANSIFLLMPTAIQHLEHESWLPHTPSRRRSHRHRWPWQG